MTIKDLERKLSARDVIIERLENKLAKSDLVRMVILFRWKLIISKG